MSNDVNLAQAILRAKEMMASPAWRDLIKHTAQEKFAKFQAYRSAGFDAKQSLELVIRETQP